MLTLSQHIKLFRDFATAHSQIKTFNWGALSELTNSEHGTAGDRLKYPIMFMDIEAVTVQGGNLNRSYNIYIIDRLAKANDNKETILNSTQLICFDVLSYFKNTPPNAKVVMEQSSQLTDVSNYTDDSLAGWTMTLTLKEAFQYNTCDIPFIN